MCLFDKLCLGIAFGGSLWVLVEDQSFTFWSQILVLTTSDSELDHLLGSPEFTLCDLLLFPKIEKKDIKLETKRVCWVSPCPHCGLWRDSLCPLSLPLPCSFSAQPPESGSGIQCPHSTVVLSPRSTSGHLSNLCSSYNPRSSWPLPLLIRYPYIHLSTQWINHIINIFKNPT